MEIVLGSRRFLVIFYSIVSFVNAIIINFIIINIIYIKNIIRSLITFFYVEEIRTDTRSLLGGGGKWCGSSGLQPTKTSTMTDPAAIRRGPGSGASNTPGPSCAQKCIISGAAVQGSLVPPPDCLAVPRR